MPDKDTVFPYDDEVVDPYEADDTKNPHEETGNGDDDTEDPADDEADETDTPPKRRPGRPRKTAS